MMWSIFKYFWIASLLPLMLACSPSPPSEQSDDSTRAKNAPLVPIVSRPLEAMSTSSNPTMFTRLDPAETGIEFQNTLLPKNIRNYLINGAGVCLGDYDADGQPDLYVVCQDGPNKLFRQVAPWKFEDVTLKAGGLEGGDYWGSGASFADINNDGFLDLFVCNRNGPNLAYINQGDGTFREEGEQRGLRLSRSTTMGAFGDFDNDGDLDLYLVNNRLFRLAHDGRELRVIDDDGILRPHPDEREEFYFLRGKMQEAGKQDQLLRNDGGVFIDVSDEAGIGGYDMGLSATWWDGDHDGFLDIYVGNDFKSPDHMYRNMGDGTFQDIAAKSVGHTAWFSMGADVADLNNDGLIDLVSADMSSTTHFKQKTTMGEMSNSAWFLEIGPPRQFMRNVVYLNSGTTRFWEIANLAGLDSTDWTWAVKLNDYDCDGLVDAYFTNGIAKNVNDSDFIEEYARLRNVGKKVEAKAYFESLPPLNERNLFFRNQGQLQFEDWSDRWGANELGTSHGCAVADIDRDGDLDMVVNHMNMPLGVYRNDSNQGVRLIVKLIGTQSNHDGIGATVTIETDRGIQTRQILLARGYMSADEPVAHFGLGDDQKIRKLKVVWPSGVIQEFEDLAGNRFYTITEQGQANRQSGNQREARGEPIFSESETKVGPEFRHYEILVNDYDFQPLLPNKLSQLGPGIAWADVNQDGFHDCFIGNGTGKAGALFLGNADQSMKAHDGPWSQHEYHEDMAPVFIDFDSDGDQDLLVVSGGYEREPGSKLLADRLYVNDGKANFSLAAEDALPDLLAAGSCACACDFDRDGDLDLFVGTRTQPRNWPMPASSYLWVNENGKFIDASSIRAKGLADIGLVTAAIWSDADGDGWTDLLLTLEWGTIKYFRNQKGELVDQTETANLANELGWWNSIAGSDVDNDGDIDYVVMNTGLNTKYHATKRHPVQLFAGDFDNNGKIDLVESEWEGDTCFPVRGKSCSSAAMPHLKNKFQSFRQFALADINQVYSEQALKKATKFVANRLDSVLLLNRGNAEFEVKSLPRLAQVSPGFGVVLEDFDLDGFVDVCIAQNFMHPQPETGQMDGGMGLLLKGSGDGDFTAMSPVESGIVVSGQGMGLAVVDLNQDAVPDIVMTVNAERTRVFLNRTKPKGRGLAIRLDAGPGNPTGVGARMILELKSGARLVREVYAGSGYLSQSAGEIFFHIPNRDALRSATIFWPDGTSEKVSVDQAAERLTFSKQDTE